MGCAKPGGTKAARKSAGVYVCSSIQRAGKACSMLPVGVGGGLDSLGSCRDGWRDVFQGVVFPYTVVWSFDVVFTGEGIRGELSSPGLFFFLLLLPPLFMPLFHYLCVLCLLFPLNLVKKINVGQHPPAPPRIESFATTEMGSISATSGVALSAPSTSEEQQEPRQSSPASAAAAAVAASAGISRDPRNDDDSQSTFCVAPVESSSRYPRAVLCAHGSLHIQRCEGPWASGLDMRVRSPHALAGSVHCFSLSVLPSPSSTSNVSVWKYHNGTRFDKFTATLSRTSEAPTPDGQESVSGEHSHSSSADDTTAPPEAQTTSSETTEAIGVAAAAVADYSSPMVDAVAATAAAAGGEEEGEGGAPAAAGKRPMGKDWLQTHPHGTPPTMRLAMQFDQVPSAFSVPPAF